MARNAQIIAQTTNKTVLKCPLCRNAIEAYHGHSLRGCNDGLGRMDLGHQNYHYIVCLNQPNGRYCEFAGDFDAESTAWL